MSLDSFVVQPIVAPDEVIDDDPTFEITGGVASVIVRLTEVVGDRVPLVPVIVRVEVLTGVVPLVVMVRVEVPEPVTVAGLKLPLAPEGRPLTLSATVPVKPPEGVTVTV